MLFNCTGSAGGICKPDSGKLPNGTGNQKIRRARDALAVVFCASEGIRKAAPAFGVWYPKGTAELVLFEGSIKMGCKCAHYDPDEGRYYCDVSGDQCMYLFPSSRACARDYGEGPDAEQREGGGKQ